MMRNTTAMRAEMRARRRSAGLTQAQLAVLVGVSRVTSGMTTQLSWLEDGSWIHGGSDYGAGERIHEAMRKAGEEAEMEYKEEMDDDEAAEDGIERARRLVR